MNDFVEKEFYLWYNLGNLEDGVIKVRKTLIGIKFIDLFCGIGGFRQALESYGAKCVFSSEWDKDAAETYNLNYNEYPAGDITKIDAASIPNHHILCAGFPCQPFSISGKQLGFEDARGTLFFDIARIAKEKKPEVLFLENVKNLKSHNNGQTLSVMLGILESLDYKCSVKVLNAVDYGIPQKRERIYIVGIKKSIDCQDFKFPQKANIVKHISDIIDNNKKAVEQAVVNRSDVFLSEKQFDCSFKSNPDRIGTVNKGGQGERIYSKYGVGVTLSAYGGGAGAKTGLYYIDGKLRRLTPRECARLQGFPDTFKINSNKNIAYKQFGNSVSVDVLQYIVKQIEKTGVLKNA